MDETLFNASMEDFFIEIEKAEGRNMHACCYIGLTSIFIKLF